MAELVLRPDPEVWQVVPDAAEVSAWYERQVATAPKEEREAVATASALALRARVDTGLSAVLLRCDPVAHLYVMLGIAALDGVPGPSTAAEAVSVAEALAPSPWPGQALPFDYDGVTGWRVTLLDEQEVGGDDQVELPLTVTTVYVADVRGRCVVAALSPLSPLVAAMAHGLAEPLVATIDIEDGDGYVG